MKTQLRREVVIEIEKIQVIRKRAKTHLLICSDCGESADFLALEKAAELFEIDKVDLVGFIEHNDCHYQTANTETVYLCVTSLLDRMKQLEGRRRLTA